MSNKSELLAAMKASVKTPDRATKVAAVELTKIGKGKLKPILKLDEESLKVFDTVVSFLDERGLIEVVDTLTVTMLAKSISVYMIMARAVTNQADIVQEFENGSSNVTGAFTAMNKAQDQVMKLSAKLGLSPMDRSRIFGAANTASDASGKAQSGDDIDNLL